MKKKIISLMIVGTFVLMLAWCGNWNWEKKQDFFIDIVSFATENQQVYITKPGKVSGKQDIVVTSQVAGRVKSIEKKDWSLVSGDQLVVSVSDTVANYGLQLQRAKNAVSRASLQKEQTKVSLDKSLTDVEIALDVAKNNLNVSKLTTEQSLKKAELDFSSATAQSQNIYLQFDLEKDNALNVLDTILHQMDSYLWVTDEYKNINYFVEPYLWGNDVDTKVKAKEYVLGLYDLREDIEKLPRNTNDSKVVLSGVSVIEKWYNKANQLLDTMKIVITNSIVTSVLPQAMLDWYRSRVDWLLWSLQWARTSVSAYSRQVNSLLTQGTWNEFIEITKSQAQIGYDMARLNSHNTIFSTEVGVKSAETNYETLQKNKDIQLSMASNAVSEANLAYQDALSRFNNLSVKSPISGVIWNVMVKVWQEIAPGTPLFTVSSNDQQSIEVYVNADERSYIAKDQIAKIIYDGQEITWTILSVSSVADRNTLYKVSIGFEAEVSLLGDVASVQLPISLPYSVLPLNVVTPISQNKWFVWLYDGTGLQRQDVILGRVWESYIEVLSGLSSWMDVVTTDVSYFDPLKFEISVKSD